MGCRDYFAGSGVQQAYCALFEPWGPQASSYVIEMSSPPTDEHSPFAISFSASLSVQPGVSMLVPKQVAGGGGGLSAQHTNFADVEPFGPQLSSNASPSSTVLFSAQASFAMVASVSLFVQPGVAIDSSVHTSVGGGGGSSAAQHSNFAR